LVRTTATRSTSTTLDEDDRRRSVGRFERSVIEVTSKRARGFAFVKSTTTKKMSTSDERRVNGRESHVFGDFKSN